MTRRIPLSLGLASLPFLALYLFLHPGCRDTNPVTSSKDETTTVASVQEQIPADSFSAIAASDASLAAVVDMVQARDGAGTVAAAGVLEDETGAKMVVGVLAGTAGDTAVVVRHCDSSGTCVSAEVTMAGDSAVVWTGTGGTVSIPKMGVPFQLRIIDETAANIDSTARLASVDSVMGGLPRRQHLDEPAAPGLARRAATPTSRKLRVLSAFGTTFDVSFSSFVSSMKQAGFNDARDIYHFNTSNLDNELRMMRPEDALIVYSHGDLSKSKGKVVGMTAAAWVYMARHYSVTRMISKIAVNSRGGPGILFLAGCQTADMLPDLDHPTRITIGVSKSVFAGHCSGMAKKFFSYFTAGSTLKESIDAVNAEYARYGIALVLNSKAYHDLTYAELGDFDRPGCRSTCVTNRDGECDDGGPGSTSGACEEGSDCYDCGPREPKMFDGEWHSSTACAEAGETLDQWRWYVKLSQTDNDVSGTINFHKCPGGGAARYAVSGTYESGTSVTLQGTKTSGRGDLNDTAPYSQTFTVEPEKAPSPNYAP
ncbi:MAG: hypothetical protein GF418_02895 [Chitinivibrionales bacterium]|nr:hypothetical protein [Chitinivibrionales bacterium]MBD3394550.1 hypothetical protein [Chitinivibrionales bacterium]